MSYHVYVTHGTPLTRIEGTLSQPIENQLKRKGAFQRSDSWWIDSGKWVQIQPMLKAMGVRIQGEDGTSELACRIGVDTYNRLTMQGYLPKRWDPLWLGHMQGHGRVGFTPYALSEIVAQVRAEKVQVELSDAARAVMDKVDDMVEGAALAKLGIDCPTVPLETWSLRDHQKHALGMVQVTGGRLFIADEPGVGKTIEAIGMKRLLGAKKVVVICPSVAKGNWRDEVKRFDGQASFIMSGRKPEVMPRVQWYIINPDILSYRLSEIIALQPDMLVVDEAHRFKGEKSQRTQALSKISELAKYFVALTGTPIPNQLIDMWPILDAIQPQWWGSMEEFGTAFTNKELDYWKMKKINRPGLRLYKYTGTNETNVDVLRARLAAMFIRRLLAEVEDLPPQTRSVYRVDLSPSARKAYDKARAEYRERIAELLADVPESQREAVLQKSAPDRAKLAMLLRRTSSMGRVHHTVELAESYIEQGQRPVVFGFFRETLDALAKGLNKRRVGLIHGGIPSEKRYDIAEAFNRGELDVIVAQLQAGGEAINLDKGSHVSITHEITYEPIHVKQSEGRIFRLTQTKPVQHIYMVGEDTMDELIVSTLLEKIRDVDAVLEGTVVESEVLRSFERSLRGVP